MTPEIAADAMRAYTQETNRLHLTLPQQRYPEPGADPAERPPGPNVFWIDCYVIDMDGLLL